MNGTKRSEFQATRMPGLASGPAIQKHLAATLANPGVTVVLYQSRGLQQIRGEHLVRSDGTIYLGTYGSVYVTGLTLSQAKAAIEEHLSQFLQRPEVAVDVLAYN